MPFQKGQSGNPGGRTKDKPFTDALRLAVNSAAKRGDKKKLRLLAEKLVARALEGDVTALKEVADRLDGKVPQGIHGPSEVDPVHLLVEYVQAARQNT